ncbi:hypothetical protein SDC9_98209 [bioreactor metagenome]|uniref:Uncharacterized protein n=1 Tax=bioreactor metagenome TaxID=1076179 RepID=A0A645AE64_9ZZZZ
MQTLLNRSVELAQHLMRFAPVLSAGRFHMGDAEGDIRLQREAEGFAARFNDLVALVARVRGIDGALFVHYTQKGEQLVVAGIAARRVDQPCGKAERAFAYAAAQHILHTPELARVRLSVGVTHRPEPERPMPHKALCRDWVLQQVQPVKESVCALQTGEVFRQIRIRRDAGDKALEQPGGSADGGKERNTAMPRHLRCDTLI